MSRSRHQSHRIRGKGKHPLIGRNRKHKPYGMCKTKYIYEVFKKLGWSPDTSERSDMGDCQNKGKARMESKKILRQQIEEYYND
jgi:hypothetical protein